MIDSDWNESVAFFIKETPKYLGDHLSFESARSWDLIDRFQWLVPCKTINFSVNAFGLVAKCESLKLLQKRSKMVV